MKKMLVYALVANVCWTANSYAAEKSGILSLIVPVLASATIKNQPFKGMFIDSGVENISYSTSSGINGRTNANGEYSYKEGDVIEFYIGNKKLGKVEAGALVTPFDFEYPNQIALLLQVIDKDNNGNNGIQISEEDYIKISNAPFEISEIDGENIRFKEKFSSSVGYQFDRSNSEAKEHALQTLKRSLLERYTGNLIPYLYESFTLSNDILAALNSKIYNLDPNYYLKSPESRLRLYFLDNYILSFLKTEREIYEHALIEREFTHDEIKEKSQSFVNLVTDVIGTVMLSKEVAEGGEAIQKLLNAKQHVSLGGVAGAVDYRQLNIFDSRFKQDVLFDIGKDYTEKYAVEYAKNKSKYYYLQLPFIADVGVIDRMIEDCFSIPKNMLDALQCISRSAGEVGMAMEDVASSWMNVIDVRKVNAVTVAIDYLRYYYLFDGQSRSLERIFSGLADWKYTFVNFNESDNADLEKALDYIAKKRFNVATLTGVQLVYNFDFAKELIGKYHKMIKGLTDNFTDNFDKSFLKKLEPDHLQIEIILEPTTVSSQYKICLAMENLYAPLKNVKGNINYSLDGNGFHSEQFNLDLFRGHSDSHTFCSAIFTWNLDASMLNRSLLEASYDLSYDVAFRENVSKSQTGTKYFELSKKSVIDDLAKPIIRLQAVQFVEPGVDVVFDTSSTISSARNDTFSFTWEYLKKDDSPDISFRPRSSNEPLKFTAPELPVDKEFYLLRFKVVAISNTSGEQSEKLVSLVVRHASQEESSTVTSATGRIWMDRNLGASRVATSITDTEAYGDLYQWGRGKDGHEKRTSGTTATLSSSDKPGHGNFILAPSSPNDWRNPPNNNLWQDGINNPCPTGFRLPTADEWQTEMDSWSSKDAIGAFASPLKITLAGKRSLGTGAFNEVSGWGDYWASTINGSRAESYSISVLSSNAWMNSSWYRADALSVRCIKD